MPLSISVILRYFNRMKLINSKPVLIKSNLLYGTIKAFIAVEVVRS